MSKLQQMIEDRALAAARHIITTGDTIRKTADIFKVSKSTTYVDVTQRLLTINPKLADEVRVVLLRNKRERHLRGGMATKKRFGY